MCSLGQNFLLTYLDAMEILLSWKQGNLTVSQLNETIFGPSSANKFFVIICTNGLLSCYGNIVTMATRELCRNLAIPKNLKFKFETCVIRGKDITGLAGCYEKYCYQDKKGILQQLSKMKVS